MEKCRLSLFISGIIIFISVYLVLDLYKGARNPASQTGSLMVGLTQGSTLPDITGKTLSGKTLTLSDTRGQIVLLNVFATWCGPCQLEAPILAEMYKELGDEGVLVVGLNVEESAIVVQGFVDRYNWQFPVLLDPHGTLKDILRPRGLPTTWIIDPEGVIQYVHTGPVTAPMLYETIQDIQ